MAVVLETVYLPADRAAPKQYAEWRKGPPSRCAMSSAAT